MQAFSLVIVHAVDHLRTVHEFLDYIERYSDDRKKPSLLDAPPLRREVREAGVWTMTGIAVHVVSEFTSSDPVSRS
jgi:hypothetical protein